MEYNLDSGSAKIYEINNGLGGISEGDRNDDNISFSTVNFSELPEEQEINDVKVVKLTGKPISDELKDIKVDMWSYMNHHKILQVWLDSKNFMKIKRRKSIYGNPICGTMIRVFTIRDEDFVTFHDSSSRDPNDSFMVKWENVPQKIKEEIGTCTNNMLHYNFDREENIFFWSFSLSKREFNHVVNLLTDGI